MSSGDLEIVSHGESLVLLPERAAYWPGESMLLIADPHFGKAAAFRAGGIPVPSGTTDNALSRLRTIVSRTDARRIAFLGDLLHAKAGRSRTMLDALSSWRATNSDLELILVRGNHDRHAGDPPGELGVNCIDAPWVTGPFALAHHPVASTVGYTIAGHIHPGIRLYGRGGDRARLPCFYFGRDYAVLPAFGDFTGLADFDYMPDDRIYAVAGDEVIDAR